MHEFTDRKRRGLRARFSEPEFGSMGLLVSDGDVGCAIIFSYTPSDFVAELLGALSLASQGVEGRAVANCEPVTYEFIFSAPDAAGTASLRIVEFATLSLIRDGGRLAAEWRGDSVDLILAFCRSLRRLESCLSPERYREEMRRPFPAEKLRALLERVKTM